METTKAKFGQKPEEVMAEGVWQYARCGGTIGDVV